MQRRRETLYFEPVNSVELVGLAILDLFAVDQNLIIQGYPVGFLSGVLPMNIPKAQEFTAQYVHAVFLHYFFFKGILNCIAELQSPASAIPTAMLIAAIGAPFVQQIIPLTIMAE